MHIDLDQVLKDFTGDPFTLAQGREPLTLRDAIIVAIKTPQLTDGNMTLIERLDLAKVGRAVFGGSNEFPDVLVELIKERISMTLNAPAVSLAIEDAFTIPAE